MATEIVEVETVTATETDTTAAARKKIMAAARDITMAMGMMIRAANEGISLLKGSIGLLGGFPRFFNILSFAFRVRFASASSSYAKESLLVSLPAPSFTPAIFDLHRYNGPRVCCSVDWTTNSSKIGGLSRTGQGTDRLLKMVKGLLDSRGFVDMLFFFFF